MNSVQEAARAAADTHLDSEIPLTSAWKASLHTAAEYGFALLVCLGLLTWLYDLPNFEWDVPLRYSGDALYYLLQVRGLIDHGWYLTNPDLGAPFRLDNHDFPIGETWHFLIIKAMALCLTSPAAVVNAYFFLGFPLATLTSLFVMRHFHVGYGPALVGSILFAFLPYHLQRGVSHLFLSSYYMVPLAMMVVIWVYQGDALLVQRGASGRLRFVWGGRTAAALAILVVLGLGEIYYSFFTAFLLGIAYLARALRTRALIAACEGLMLTALLATCAVANTLPSWLYAREHGPNPDGTRRMMNQNEGFALRMAQMLMPISGHRVPFLAYVKEKFNSKLPLVTENDMAALGLAGSLGFLALLLRLLQPPSRTDHLWLPLSRLTLFALLLGTLGGFGLLVAAAVPQIRAYNRISLMIGFFALFAVALLLDACRQRWAQTPWRKRGYLGLLALVMIGGVLDQSPPGLVRAHVAETFREDAQFVQALEGELPPGSAVYQMPYVPFPEGGSYDHLRLYLHGTQTRWSFAAMRGRPADYWHKELSVLPMSELAPRLAYADFAGICLDRRQYSQDQARALERELTELLQVRPLICPKQRWAFYALTSYRQTLQARHTPEEWEARRQDALQPLLMLWGRGFTQTRELRPKDGRWCSAAGQLQFVNLGEHPRTATVTLRCATGHSERSRLRLHSPLLSHETVVSQEPSDVTFTICVPPGRHVVAVECNALCVAGQERRVLHVSDFGIEMD
jgi:phosphoglycerol transferase